MRGRETTQLAVWLDEILSDAKSGVSKSNRTLGEQDARIAYLETLATGIRSLIEDCHGRAAGGDSRFLVWTTVVRIRNALEARGIEKAGP